MIKPKVQNMFSFVFTPPTANLCSSKLVNFRHCAKIAVSNSAQLLNGFKRSMTFMKKKSWKPNSLEAFTSSVSRNGISIAAMLAANFRFCLPAFQNGPSTKDIKMGTRLVCKLNRIYFVIVTCNAEVSKDKVAPA